MCEVEARFSVYYIVIYTNVSATWDKNIYYLELSLLVRLKFQLGEICHMELFQERRGMCEPAVAYVLLRAWLQRSL